MIYIFQSRYVPNCYVFLLKLMKLDNRTSIPGQYDHPYRKDPVEYWTETPQKLIIDIYRHYYQDFLAYGFSPDDVRKYINMGSSENNKGHYESKRAQSRRVFARFHKENIEEKSNDEYHICK